MAGWVPNGCGEGVCSVMVWSISSLAAKVANKKTGENNFPTGFTT
jgi:hypothetical protein